MNPRLAPPLASVQRAVRKPLVDWLRTHDVTGLRLLDVGCGDRPYDPLFTAASEVVGFDREGNEHADLHGTIEAIPVADATFDLVLCLQVLEHVPDPGAAVAELHRVVRPGGRVLASTHGVAPLHPNPDDLWRWTPQGLERLFLASGTWDSVTVRPGAGTAQTIAMLNAHLVDLFFKRLRLRAAATPFVVAANAIGERLDRAIPLLRSTVPGTLHANYHVEAVRA